MHLFVNTHVRINIYRELYHGFIYIANEGRHVRMPDKCGHKSTSDFMYIFFFITDSGIYIHLFIKIPLEMFMFFFIIFIFTEKN